MRLQLLILSPVFPSLLSFILLIVYKIYLDPATLCDDGDWYKLYELKVSLTKEIANYNISIIKVEEYTNLQAQLNEISRPNLRDFSKENLYSSKLDTWQTRSVNSLNNVRVIEYSITQIDPNFRSSAPHLSFSNTVKR